MELSGQQSTLLTVSEELPFRHKTSQYSTEHYMPKRLPWRKGWLLKKSLTLLLAVCVIGISAGIFLYKDRITEFRDYGYLGAFLANLISNATVFLPVPSGLIVIALGAFLSPLLVGVAAGAGAAIGEMSGYLLGYSGRAVIRNSKTYERSVLWLKRWGAVTIFVFAVTPLPFDLAAIAAGALRFPLWKFLIACWLGKTTLSLAIALAGAWGWKIAVPYLS